MRDRVVIVDVDGTLANVDHCRHHVVKSHPDYPGKRDFDKFHLMASKSPVIEHVRDMVNDLYVSHKVVILTARKEAWRYETATWLLFNNVNFDQLIMRKQRDGRKPDQVKQDVVMDLRSQGLNPVMAIDDSPYNIAMFESLGLKTITVPGWME